jgi:hypothetical protein
MKYRKSLGFRKLFPAVSAYFYLFSLRCHIPVSGHVLLGLANASGSIGLLRLMECEVSDKR